MASGKMKDRGHGLFILRKIFLRDTACHMPLIRAIHQHHPRCVAHADAMRNCPCRPSPPPPPPLIPRRGELMHATGF